MGTKAYFMVNLDKRLSEDGYYLDALRELEAMPEVESVEPVSGVCDLLVKVETPIRIIFAANKIMAKEWVKRLYVLNIEPSESKEYHGLTSDEIIRLKRVIPAETTR